MCKPDLPERGIGDVGGFPRSPDSKKENEKWKLFKFFLGKKIKKGAELGESFVVANVSKRQSEVRKNLEEAARINAERKNIEAEERLKKQKEVQEFSKTVDDIFANDGQPSAAKKLKLAKLINNNPEIESQINKINDLIDRLSYTKGTVFELQESSIAGGESSDIIIYGNLSAKERKRLDGLIKDFKNVQPTIPEVPIIDKLPSPNKENSNQPKAQKSSIDE
jgi:hypothetical protein